MSETPRTEAEQKQHKEIQALIFSIIFELGLETVSEEKFWFCYRLIKASQETLERELNEARKDWKAKQADLMHKKFFFQPHPDDKDKCNCAYCARDFEAVAEHAAYLEMDVHSLENDRDRLKYILDFLVNEQLPADESQVEFSGPVYLCTSLRVKPGCELEALEKFIKEVTK